MTNGTSQAFDQAAPASHSAARSQRAIPPSASSLMRCKDCGTEQHSNNNLPSYPWLEYSILLQPFGTAGGGDSIVWDLSDARHLFVQANGFATGAVQIQIGEGSPNMRLPIAGGVISCSGFRKLRMFNPGGTGPFQVTILTTADPNFGIAGFARTTY